MSRFIIEDQDEEDAGVQEEQLIADEREAYEAGAAFHQEDPEALMIEVWRQADRLYQPFPSKHKLQAFYMGFRDARLKRVEYLTEKGKLPT